MQFAGTRTELMSLAAAAITTSTKKLGTAVGRASLTKAEHPLLILAFPHGVRTDWIFLSVERTTHSNTSGTTVPGQVGKAWAEFFIDAWT